MIEFDPLMSVVPLASVSPGSLIRWDEQEGQVGFAVRAMNNPNGAISLVQYDAAARQFNWRYGQGETVLAYEGAVVVRPDMTSFSPSFAIGADGSLFWLDGAPHISLQVGGSTRFLDLGTGELKSLRSWPMVGGFRAWTAGVRGATGEFHGLVDVTAP